MNPIRPRCNPVTGAHALRRCGPESPRTARGPAARRLHRRSSSYGSGVGLGIGLNLSPKPKEQVATELAVSIRDRTSGTVLWEGRASFVVTTASPLAGTALGAPKMSEALFLNFPGQSGETIEVK